MDKVYIIFEGCQYESEYPISEAYTNLAMATADLEGRIEGWGYTKRIEPETGEITYDKGPDYVYIRSFDVIVG